ncbi:MAG: hypothetical protein ABEK10_01560 [Candidatus Nanosalina sp.]
MDDKIIASYLEKDGSKASFLPHNEKSMTARWDSESGLTLSSNGRERFFPNHRVLEVNRFTEAEDYIWYSIQQDPVIDQFHHGEKAELKEILMEMEKDFDEATYDELENWLSENSEIENDAVKGSMIRIAFSSGKIQPETSEQEQIRGQRGQIEA